MITIEIHGLPVDYAKNLGSRIFRAIKSKKYAEGVTVEIYATETMTIAKASRPFLRLATNYEEHAYEILTLLQDFTAKNTNPKMSVGFLRLSDY